MIFPVWMAVALLLVVLFSAISVVGALRRIAAASERTAAAAERTADATERLAGADHPVQQDKGLAPTNRENDL